jgi:hypothetical protein
MKPINNKQPVHEYKPGMFLSLVQGVTQSYKVEFKCKVSFEQTHIALKLVIN